MGRVWDALKVEKKVGSGKIDFFQAYGSNNDTTTTEGDDHVFTGLYSMWDFGEYLKETDFYLLRNHKRADANAPLTYVAGLRIKSKKGAIDYRYEGTFQKQNLEGLNNVTGFQEDLEVGYNIGASGYMRVAAEAFIASSHYNQLYPLGHKYLGHVDLLGRRNLKGFGASYRMKLADDLKFWLTYQSFRRYKRKASVFKVNGTAYAGASNSKDLGQEIDSWVKYSRGNDGDWILGGGYFMPGKFFKDQSAAKDDAVRFGYLMYMVKF